MKTLLITLLLIFGMKSYGQEWKQTQGYHGIINLTPPIPTNTVTRTVIDRFELLSIKYDTKEVRELDSLSCKDSYLKNNTSFRIVFEMPGLHFQQRLRSDTLEITQSESVNFIKIGEKVYILKKP